MPNLIVWYIDENDRELRTYERELALLMPEDVEVKGMLPLPQKESYLPLLDSPGIACLIIDHKLKNTGIANYTGIELAQYLRGVNSKLPIFLFTNFAHERDDFAAGEWSVEQIISKDELQDSVRAHAVAARILRHLNTYSDLVDERAERFGYLLRKSLIDELGEDEQEELSQLQFARTATTLAQELSQLDALEEMVTRYKALMDQFKQASGEEEEHAD